jgi:hypothetical protein
MPISAPERILVHPSAVEPNLIITTAQASGFVHDLGGGELRQLLSENDKVVYQNHVDIRTQVAAQQAAANVLPGATITLDYIQTLAYLIRTRQNYNHLDVADAGEWNVNLPMAYQLGARQGIAQQIRNANLYGFNAANNEGLLNTPNAVNNPLPPDPYGNTTVVSYDNGAMYLWLLGQIGTARSAMYSLNAGPQKVVFLAPQRELEQWQYQGVIQVTSYQRPGAGTATIGQAVQAIGEANLSEITWACDDTLIGKGSGGSDAVLLIIPEAVVPESPINTNVFAKLTPQMSAMTLQYTASAAPIELTGPIGAEAVDFIAMQRITSGWAPRPQAITILSMTYN